MLSNSSLILEPNQKIVFIGDSITDCGRRDRSAVPYGNGYVALVRALILARHSTLSLEVVNRGIGGDTIRDLEGRWDRDAIAAQPPAVWGDEQNDRAHPGLAGHAVIARCFLRAVEWGDIESQVARVMLSPRRELGGQNGPIGTRGWPWIREMPAARTPHPLLHHRGEMDDERVAYFTEIATLALGAWYRM